MVRTQVYITKDEYEGLKNLSTQLGKKQSELIRNAIDDLITSSQASGRLNFLKKARGIWKNRKDLPDFSVIRNELGRNY